MKKLNDPLSVMRVINNKISKYRLIIIMLLIIISSTIITYNSCMTKHRQKVFDKLDITFKEVKAVEYGTANYNPIDLVEKVSNGEIVNYTKSVDTTSVGTQELTFVVKEENVYKVINVEVEVVDTEKPDIMIEKENISIEQGNDYNTMDNIISVIDKVDGNLEYQKEYSENIAHYTITTDLDTNVAGNYSVNIKAVDKHGNESEKKYSINVVEKPKPQPISQTKPQEIDTHNSNNISASVDTSSVVSAAKSYIGYRYTPGGASPETGFDCSGFVYYIYGLFGKKVGRSTRDLMYSGTQISKESMEPGDIIVWSSNPNNTPTHAALYIGDGNMIHAANSKDGVIISSINHWETYAGHIVSIRRV